MNAVRTLAAALFFPALLSAQELRPVPPADDAIMQSFKFIAARYGNWLMTAFDSIPSARYGYRPTPTQQSVGFIAQHLENANYALCNRLGPIKHLASPNDAVQDTIKATWPKDTLVRRLKASLAFCDTAMAQLNDAKLDDPVPYGPPAVGATALTARSLLLFVTDLAEHYSQIASYMRLIGLVPPSALPPKPRIAIDVAVDVLSRYVGKYDLPPSRFQDAPGFLLDVTLKDGALYLQPSGRPAVRLWPETSTDFFAKEVDAQIAFTRNASGAVVGLVLRQNGENRPARKVP